MNLVINFFGGGTAFFAGVIGVPVAVALAGGGRRVASSAVVLIALAFVTLSATPLPPWFYWIAGTVSVGWQFVERFRRTAMTGLRKWARVAVVMVWLAGAGMELPYQLTPTLPRAGARRLTIIGDSISAGTGERGVVPWPKLFAAAHGVAVDDRSRVGATAGSASRKAVTLPLADGVVLLEIGGNDLLGGTAAADFERDLDKLLTLACGPGRVVAMFELPLPPFANGFGRAQRRLAARHGVALVPKRAFAGVLTADGATTDGLHLSAAGHERMAGTVWDVLRPAFD